MNTIEDYIKERERLEEEAGSCFMAEEPSWRNMADELQELHYLKGAQFVNQLKLIVCYGEFHSVEGESDIFSALGEQSPDYDNLLNAARKAVEHGYRVYILPNPKGIRTADYIFVRKGIYRLYDLKTIQGKSSVFNRLSESVGQTNHVLLNMAVNYNARLLASDIKAYFEINDDAVEVLIFRGNKMVSIKRSFASSPTFNRTFRKIYEK